MRQYEATVVLGRHFSPDRQEEIFSLIDDIFKKHSAQNISRTEMGKKRLAYPIKKTKEGFFFLYLFEMDPSLVEDLKRMFLLSEFILTFIVIQKNFKKEKEKEKQKEKEKGSNKAGHCTQ